MSTTIKKLNQWLQDNNISEVVFNKKKDSMLGTVIGLYEVGTKRNRCVMHSPAHGELTSAVCTLYDLDLNTRP